jgi:catechol 2,3-dioxygenase-like lactoylglutathione lyase family enzyme
MNIEHFALNVPDPVALAEWYVRHLGMRVVRADAEPPYGHFLADEAGRVVMEVYRQTAPVPDYFAMDPLVLHVALVAADVEGTRERLTAAGGTAVGEVVTTPAGDVLAWVRDPWGIPLQLVKRSRALLG